MDDTDREHRNVEDEPDAGQDRQEGEHALDAAEQKADDDWHARLDEADRRFDDLDSNADDAQDGPARPDDQHRWRRLIAVALALACFGWLVTTTLASFAFLTVLNQNDEHVDALSDLLEDGQAQRSALLGSAEEQADQRQAALATERATTRANTAQVGESTASRDAAHADEEQSRSEGSLADAEARSLEHSADLAEDRQRSDEMVASSVARGHDAQGALARAQARLARSQTKLTASQKQLLEAQQRAADALAALADSCRERGLPGCFSVPIDVVGPGPVTDR